MWRPFRKARPRLRVRTLLVLVGLAAVLIAAEQMWRRYVYCREKVRLYTRMERHYLDKAAEEEREIRREKDEIEAARVDLEAQKLRREPQPVFLKNYEQYVRNLEGLAALDVPFRRELAAEDRRMAEFCARLKDHYQGALRRPWAAVKPHESEPFGVP